MNSTEKPKQPNTTKSSSSGFSAVMMLVAVLVIAAIGLSGWYVWHNNQTKKTSATSNSTTQKTTPTKTPAVDPSEGGKYLVIKEWGIRVALPDELKGDVTYGITTHSDNTQTASLAVGKIEKLPGSTCTLVETQVAGESGKRGGIGVMIDRTPQKISQDKVPLYYKPATNLSIGGYWYSAILDQSADTCAGQSNQQLVVDTSTTLLYSLDKLETTTN